MGLLDRFFGKSPAGARLVANTALTKAMSLALVFPGKLQLDARAVAASLRKYHPSMANAACEIDAALAQAGTPLGLLGWDEHVVRIVAFDVPMPAAVLEQCVEGAHYPASLKAKVRAHASHALLYYAGTQTDPLEQYVVLAAACGVLSRHGAIAIVNEAGHTSLPAVVLSGEGMKEDMIALLRSFPIPMLYSGFVKFDVEGVQGVWMRTFGNHLLDLPDFAHLATSHAEGQSTMDLMSALLRYLLSSKRKFADGHTMEIGDVFVKVRLATPEEYFLKSEGALFVLEKLQA